MIKFFAGMLVGVALIVFYPSYSNDVKNVINQGAKNVVNLTDQDKNNLLDELEKDLNH